MRGEHVHESWQEYEQCNVDIQGKHTLHRELHALRGAKNELCQVCTDIFVDHAEAQCLVGQGFENQSLPHFWDHPIGSFVRFIGMMEEHERDVETGPCPLCNIQEDQHNYVICLRMANVELKEGMLNVTTGGTLHLIPTLQVPLQEQLPTPHSPCWDLNLRGEALWLTGK